MVERYREADKAMVAFVDAMKKRDEHGRVNLPEPEWSALYRAATEGSGEADRRGVILNEIIASFHADAAAKSLRKGHEAAAYEQRLARAIGRAVLETLPEDPSNA